MKGGAARTAIARCSAAAAAALLGGSPGTARAATVEGAVQWTSDSVLRGLSQSNGRPTPQGGVLLRSAGGTFAGVWATTVVFNPAVGRRPEFDLYAGHRWEAQSGAALQATATRYVYPRDSASLRYDYTELALQVDLGDRLTVGAAWSPDYSRNSSRGTARDESAVSIELAVRQPLSAGTTAFASAAHHHLAGPAGGGYGAYGTGVRWDSGQWSLVVQRFATDGRARRWYGDQVAGVRWAGTVAWRF